MKLTSNITKDMFFELRESFMHNTPCSTCPKPCNANCYSWARKGDCKAVTKDINEYVCLSTGSGLLGFQYALKKNDLIEELTKILEEYDFLFQEPNAEAFLNHMLLEADKKENWEALTIFTLLDKSKVEYPYTKVETRVLHGEWYWKCYRDGSGCLCQIVDKEHKPFVSYDVCRDYIEYYFHREDERPDWSPFYGTFDEFRKFVEEQLFDDSMPMQCRSCWNKGCKAKEELRKEKFPICEDMHKHPENWNFEENYKEELY